MTQARAVLKNLSISPRKVRLVSNSIKGMHVQNALAQLDTMTQRSVKPIAKLIRSAIANAKEGEMNTDKLVIQSIRVDKGIVLKRAVPRARGRATLIEKKRSRITLELVESDHVSSPKFVLRELPKKEKKQQERVKDTPKPRLEDTGKEKTKRGFASKIFRRKSA